MVKRADLESMIVSEWLKRPAGQRTEADILVFYGHLQREKPHLLAFRVSGDRYQRLKSILRHRIEG